jgi:hypothetical protein
VKLPLFKKPKDEITKAASQRMKNSFTKANEIPRITCIKIQKLGFFVFTSAFNIN